MPLFYQDVAHILSLLLKSELDAFPRMNGAVSVNSLGQDMMTNANFDKLNQHLESKESKHCYKSFQDSLLDACSLLVHSLLKQNMRDFNMSAFINRERDLTLWEEIRFQEYYMKKQLIPHSGIVRNNNEIKKVIDSGIFNYFLTRILDKSWDLERQLQDAACQFYRIKDKSYDYSNKKYEKKLCQQCSGCPCLYGGDSGAHDVNLILEEVLWRSKCPWRDAYIDFIESCRHPELLQGEFTSYLSEKGAVNKRAIIGLSLTSGCNITVPDAGQVKWMEIFQQKISHINYGGKRWIEKELPKLIPKQRGIHMLVPLIPFVGGALLGGAFTILSKP